MQRPVDGDGHGTLRFTVPEGTIKSRDYIRFLKQLIRGRERPLILLVDRVSFHRSKAVRRFVRRHRQRLRIYFLPRYSPELNPDEQLWQEIKNNHLGRQFIGDKKDLRAKLYSALRSVQKQGERIRSFFQLPDTRYAAL